VRRTLVLVTAIVACSLTVSCGARLPKGGQDALHNYLLQDMDVPSDFRYSITSAKRSILGQAPYQVDEYDEVWCVTVDQDVGYRSYADNRFFVQKTGDVWVAFDMRDAGFSGEDTPDQVETLIVLGCDTLVP